MPLTGCRVACWQQLAHYRLADKQPATNPTLVRDIHLSEPIRPARNDPGVEHGGAANRITALCINQVKLHLHVNGAAWTTGNSTPAVSATPELRCCAP